MPFVAAPITLDFDTRAILEARVAAHTSPQRDVKRARIILMAADGFSSSQISREIGMHESNVAQWRKRFLAEGLDGLDDKPRSGGPEVFTNEERLEIAAIATSKRNKPDGRETWTYEEIHGEANSRGIKISLSYVWNVLSSFDIKPHRVKGWLNRSDDPDFWERVDDVCGLYLAAPKRAVVFSIDEKTGMQATSHKHEL